MTPRLIAILAAAGLLTLAAAAAAFTAVPQSRPRADQPDMMAGLGDRPGTPVGEPLNLHPDLRILSVKGYLNDEECEGPEVGQGEQELCLTVCSVSKEPIYLDYHQMMPIVREVAGGKGKQNIFMIGNGRVQVRYDSCGPGGMDKDEEEELKRQAEAGTLPEGIGVQFRLKGYCLNVSKDIPNEGDVYDITSRAGNPQLKEIAALIEGKTLTDDGIDLVQDAVWEVTDYGGLTDEMRAKLRAI